MLEHVEDAVAHVAHELKAGEVHGDERATPLGQLHRPTGHLRAVQRVPLQVEQPAAVQHVHRK
eukprot:4855987-Pyramimonas_sp.AAC.1